MNGGFRKNKGIIIELTSLLDVILIMLFWLILNMSNTAANAEKKAQEQIDAANAKVEQAKQDAQKQIDSINEQNEQMRKQAENMQRQNGNT